MCSIAKAVPKNFAIHRKRLRWSLQDSNTGISCEYCEIFKNTFLEEYLQTAAPGNT